MNEVRLTPVERMVLRTAPDVRSMLAVVRAARKEMDTPGSGAARHLGFGDVLRFVMLMGFQRQPLMFLVAPLVAVACYIGLLYQVFS